MPPGKKKAPPEGRAKRRDPDGNRHAGIGTTEGGNQRNHYLRESQQSTKPHIIPHFYCNY